MVFFYHATMRVDGILWFHTVARTISNPKLYSHTIIPFIHNYGLTLALAGYIVDPDVGYVSIFDVKKYKRPIDLYKKYGVYSYPAIATKTLVKDLFMSAIGEPLIEVKKEGRMAYPVTTRNTVLMPGSTIETLVVSRNKLPHRLVLRIGAKRYGVLKTELTEVTPKIIEDATVSHPFNVNDTQRVEDYVVVLKHEAGDVAILGRAERAFQYRVRMGRRSKTVTLPCLKEVGDQC